MILGGIQFIVGNNKAIKNAAKRSVSRQKRQHCKQKRNSPSDADRTDGPCGAHW
jgi:hypothetical protein